MEQSSINVFERISAEYYNLTTAEKKAADYVLSHQRKAQDMSITELAAASGVAEATVSRFCRRLGCKGYNAFRLAIANSIAQRPQQSNPLSGEVLDDDSFSDVCKKLYTANVSAMTQTLELVRPEEYIRAADVLIIAGTSLSVYPAAGLVRYYRGNKLVVINKTPLENGVRADLAITGAVGETLAQL